MARKDHTSCGLEDKEKRAVKRPSTKIKARPQKRLGQVLTGIVLVMASVLIQTAQPAATCKFIWNNPKINTLKGA